MAGYEPSARHYRRGGDRNSQASGRPEGSAGRWSSRVTCLGALVVLGVVVVMVGLLAWWAGGGQRARVSAPPRIDGLVREDTPGARDTTARLLTDLARGLPLVSTSSAVYADTRGESRSVIFVGGAGVLVSPTTTLNRAFQLLTDDAGPVQGIRAVPAGPLGGTAECGFSGSETGPQAICGWADRRSLGVAIFTNRPVEEAAALLPVIRGAVETRASRTGLCLACASVTTKAGAAPPGR